MNHHDQNFDQETDRMIAELGTAPEQLEAQPESVVAQEQHTDEFDSQPVVDYADQLASLAAERDKANQRWNVLQGINRKQAAENEELKQRLAALEAKVSQPTPQQPTQQFEVTADIRDEFGDDLIKLITGIAELVSARAAAQVQAQLAELQKQFAAVGKQVGEVSTNTYLSKLGALVPNWQQIWGSNEFKLWAAEVDQFSGQTREALMLAADAAGDADRVAVFFNAYEAENKPVQRQPDVSKLVSPGKSKAGGSTEVSKAQGRVWTEREISALYDPRNKNRYGTPAEHKALMEDADRAYLEGRVKP